MPAGSAEVWTGERSLNCERTRVVVLCDNDEYNHEPSVHLAISMYVEICIDTHVYSTARKAESSPKRVRRRVAYRLNGRGHGGWDAATPRNQRTGLVIL